MNKVSLVLRKIQFEHLMWVSNIFEADASNLFVIVCNEFYYIEMNTKNNYLPKLNKLESFINYCCLPRSEINVPNTKIKVIMRHSSSY